MASAADASIETMRAAGCCDGRIATCSMPSSATSATKWPWPATKRRSSRTRRLVETKRKAAGSRSFRLHDGLIRAMVRPRRVGFAQSIGGELDRFDDLPVAGAAADVARDRLDNVVARRR